MLEQLKQVDTSVIEELMAIKRERETVAERLARMGGEHGKVSDVVFRRVKRDYETRATALERQAAPLKDRARQEYAKLKALLDRIEGQHSAAKLDREEIDFRHHLGEFAAGEYEKKVAELDARLAEQEGDLAEASEVKSRFVDAFDSEADLAAATPAPAPPAATAPPVAPAPAEPPALAIDQAAITAPQPIEPPPPPPAPRGGAAAPPPPAPARANGTVILPSEGTPPPAPAPSPAHAPAPVAEASAGRTVILSLAKLVAVDTDIGAAEFPLEPLSFVGRTPDNQVRLNKPAVSRRHAQLTQGEKGWTIKDLQSENGSYVNGEKISERLLADGDRVQIGTVRLVFRAG